MAWILFGIVALFVVWPVLMFNRLVRMRNDVRDAWSQIDVQLKRRHDLIPNLVSVVKGYMDFERDTLERVVVARTGAMKALRMGDKAVSENALSDALGKLFIVFENYPSIKSNENAMRLQEELATTENRIAFSRQLYNDLVANYMTRREVFPDNVIASLFSFSPAEYFAADKEDRARPSVLIAPDRS